MPRGREPGHVDAYLADDRFSHSLVDPRSGGQTVPLVGERGDHPVDLDREPFDRLVR